MAALHKMSEGKVKEGTAIARQSGGLFMEPGIVIKKGLTHIRVFLPTVVEDFKNALSMQARDYLSELYVELVACDTLIKKELASEFTVV